ncbi:YfiR family protein [Desulfococcaceae bacterium HSG7]|nr:YfiR family protein [Desulfococcaceae bacterium HSG7]
MNRKPWVIIITVVTVCTVILGHVNVGAQSVQSTAQIVKATFLYNFAKFINWPDKAFKSPDSPILLCILGENTLGEALTVIKNKAAGGRRLLIRYCSDVAETDGCHILFISPSEKENFSHILEEIKGTPCLTVSDTETFTQHGGMIYLFQQGNKIRFEINLEASKEARIKISSQLLKLARLFKTDEQGGKR